ncbi:MAG: flagellar filament capping protein FliD [Pseudohongiella sp.]|nr:flagellar filament capping protein FliD [Pseudohongiella sp.]
MASISSLGIGSGLLTSELLENLIEAERKPAEARLNAQQELVDAKISAFGEVSSAVSTLSSALKSLNSLSAFNASTAVSSKPDALSATASSIAGSGNYSINVQSLAQQHTIATQSYNSVNEAIGTGVLTFRFGTTDVDEFNVYQSFAVNPEKTSRNIIISSSNNTLAGMRDAINNAKMGVQATIVDDGSGFRLLLTSEQAGAANSIELTATGTAGMSAFNFNQNSQAAAQTQAGQNAQFSVNGLAITRDSNLVAGVIPGVTLNLKETTTGPVSLSVGKDPAALIEKVQEFIGSYNKLKVLSDSLTRFSADSGQGSLLTGDATLRRMMSDIGGALRSVNSTLDIKSMSEIGITTNQFNSYQLELNATTFRDAFTSNPQAITSLFAANGVASDSQVSFIRAGSQTAAGQYAVDITRLATTGTYAGVTVAALGAGNIVIDAGNKSFTIRLNSSEVAINLTEATYASAAELAEEIQLQINSNAEILDAEDTVTVSFNAAQNRFDMTSNRYGAESVVQIVNISAEASATLGLVLNGQGPFRGNQMAALGNTTGDAADPFDTPLVVDSNTEFSLSVSGVSTGVLSLPQTTYNTPDELTSALKTLIDNAFADEGIEVFVNYVFDQDSDFGRLVFSTANAGDSFAFSNVNVEASQRLGLHLGNGAAPVSTRGVDVAGKINGIEAIGRGQILSAASGEEAARPGFYLNTAYGNLAASTSADRFRVAVDGVLSGNITLGAITNTDPLAVAAAMQAAINNDVALIAAGVSVQVQFDVNSGGFGIISNSTGATSSVQIANLQGNAASIFGFVTGSGAQGAIGRNAIGQADGATGLVVRIEGNSTGNRGIINYSRGVADQLSKLLDTFLSSEGLLGTRQASLGKELDAIADDRISLAQRLAKTERRLQASFLANDIIISKFNTTGDFLKSQLTMLEALATPRRER